MTFAQPFRDYEVLDRIGAGSMGTVFKARHKKLGRNVALKVLKPSLGRDSRYVDRLRREARIVASLNHPNIVTGYDLGNEGGYHFFVMEYVQGKSLRELLDEWGMFSEEQVLDVAIQITTALDHAFERGVIHRDIKPGNILIDESNSVKLTDMGLAKGPEDLTLTRAGATVGTPQYISPEQAKDPQAVDVRSDLYSLGATLFHMCTGQPPFRAETMASVLIKVLEERAPSAAGLNPDLSDGLNLIVRKLLSKDPGRRYQTPGELLEDLRRVQRFEPPDVAEEDLDRGEEPARSNLLVLGVTAILLVVTGSLVAFLPDWSGPTPDPGVDSVFGRAVERELARLPRVGEKIGHVRQLLARASAEERVVLQAQQEGLEEDLRSELLGLLVREEQELGANHADLRWVGASRDLQLRLEARILETLGIAPQVLPAAAREDYLAGWERISARVSQLDAKRERALENAVDEWSITVGDRLQSDLRTQDFARAQQNLRAGVGGYEGLAGSPPLAALPQPIREYVEAARERTRMLGEAELDRAEESATAAFEQTLGRRLEAILAGARIDPIAAERDLTAMEAEMREDYPPGRSTTGRAPWLGAESRLKEARAAVRLISTDELDRRFRTALERAYEAALAGNIEAAIEWLDYFARDVPQAKKGPHLELLANAASLRDRLLRALGPGKQVSTRDGLVEVVEVGSTLSLRVGDEEVELPQLRVAELVEAARPGLGSLTEGEEAGLALWYFLSGEQNETARLLDDVLADIVDFQLEAPRHEGLDAQRLLVRAGRRLEGGDWQGASELVATLRRDHPEFAEAHAVELSQMGPTIERGRVREDLSNSLERLRRIGVQVEVGRDLSVHSVYDIAKVEWSLPSGWERDGEVLRATEASQILGLETGIPVEGRVWASIDLSFPDESIGSRFVFLECHGAMIGVGMLADGRMTVKSIYNEGEASRVSREIREALGEAESSRRFVVPGARHRFDVRVHRKDDRQLSVSVDVDGREVIKGRLVHLPRDVAARFEIAPSHPLSVHRMEFRSVAGGG